MKKMIVRIGYNDYALDAKDAIALMDIADRAIPVKRQGYDGPFFPDDSQTFATQVEVGNFIDPPPVPKPTQNVDPARPAPAAPPTLDDEIAF